MPIETDDQLELPELDPAGRSGVYAIMGVPGWVKIGKAKSIARRMFDLQVGHPVPLRLVAVLSGDMAHEGILHARFRHLRACGEWFRITDELMRVITGQEHPFAHLLDSVRVRERAQGKNERRRFRQNVCAKADTKQPRSRRRAAQPEASAPPTLTDIRDWLSARRAADDGGAP